MSPPEELPRRAEDRFPRVSGDEPKRAAEAILKGSFSPRERG